MPEYSFFCGMEVPVFGCIRWTSKLKVAAALVRRGARRSAKKSTCPDPPPPQKLHESGGPRPCLLMFMQFISH
jgi:hypothetical protein